jgi:hypothetical protein
MMWNQTLDVKPNQGGTEMEAPANVLFVEIIAVLWLWW